VTSTRSVFAPTRFSNGPSDISARRKMTLRFLSGHKRREADCCPRAGARLPTATELKFCEGWPMRKLLNSTLGKLERLRKKAFRDAYVRAHIEQGIAHQIRILRLAKNWSQQKLALQLGSKGQSMIARLEDPSYGRYSLNTLIKLASVFDVALLIKFVPYSRLLWETENPSPKALNVESFEADYPRLLQTLKSGSIRISEIPPTRSIQGEPISIIATDNSPRPFSIEFAKHLNGNKGAINVLKN
jgi:transcriptional regulator with XRE-family HTH domain